MRLEERSLHKSGGDEIEIFSCDKQCDCYLGKTTMTICESAPSDGMRNSVMAGHHAARRCNNAWNLWDRRIFKVLRVRHRYFDAAHSR